MIFARTLLLCLALLGCEPRRAPAPDWVASAPPAAVLAVSFRTDWALEQPRLQNLLERFPLAGRSLDLVLTRVRMNTSPEGGRLTVYLARPGFLLQLGGFRDPGGIQVAIADAFPVDGQAADNPNQPLFVVLDLPPSHVRAMADKDGRVWLGDPAALAGVGSGLRARRALAACADWINPSAAIQGFIRPPELLADPSAGLPGDLARDLPRGIEALAWGLTPGAGQDPANGFELALAGSPQAIQQAAPWLQRFVAAATAMQGTAAPTPEILQEPRRIGLRCQLTQEQVDVAMAKLGQPPMPCR